MLIVMPRAFSSGALSIMSNAVAVTFGFFAASTLVIAAVSVVLPWSMCPMVPMFRCGLFRSNFSLAICSVSVRCPSDGSRRAWFASAVCLGGSCWVNVRLLATHSLDDLLRDRLRNLGVGVELHRVRRAPLGAR